MRPSAPLTGHAFLNREEKIDYKGFQGPGRGREDLDQIAGRALVARLDFGKLDQPLELKVAISSVDEDGAIANLESTRGNFDAVRAGARDAWEKALGAIQIEAPAPTR